jgi:branched-chain amino acid transport system permease protein
VTLAFGEIVPSVIWHVPYWTGGPNGLTGVPLPPLGPLDSWPPPLRAYTLGLVLASLGCLAALRLAGSPLGRAWAATRDDETAAESIGLDAGRTKLLAFAVGAAYAGVAGAVYVGLLSYVEPGQFDLTVSLMVLAAVVIGGRWGLVGVVLGALVVAAYDRVLADAVSSLVRLDLRANSSLLFGLALYVGTLLRTGWLQDQLAGRRPSFRAVRQTNAQRAIGIGSENDHLHLAAELSQAEALALTPEPPFPGRSRPVEGLTEPRVEPLDQ